MYGPQHVRRNPGQPNQPAFDPRMPTNPQPIPNSAPRNLASGAARSFPSYSPSQSPQHSGGYFPSPSVTHDINRGHGAPVSGATPVTVNKAPHTNGTPPIPHMYTTPQRHYGPPFQPQMQPPYTTPVTKHPNAPQIHSGHQYPQQSPHTTPTGVMQHGSPYMFLPHGGMPPALRPRYVPTSQTPSIINPTQAQLQPASPTYYHQPAGYFQSPMQTVPGYYGDTSHMQYHQPQQTQPIVIPTQQTPQQAPQHQQQVNSGSSTRNRSKVIIRDPNTLADVTSDVLQQPKKEGGAATGRSSATPTPPGQTVQNSDQQIVAQFAAQVAAAATGSPGRSPAPPAHVPMSTAPVRATPVHFHPPSPQQRGGQSNVVIPSGVDTSLPPPTMPPNMNVPPPDITMQPATPQTYVAPLTTPAAPRPTPEQSYQEPPSKTATPEVRTQMHKSAPPDVVPQSVPIVTKRTEQPVPVAVVQPQQQTNNSSTASVINDASEKEAELKPEPIEEKKEEGAPDLISNTGVELTLEKINDTDTTDVNAKETSQNIEEKTPEENKVGDAPVIGKDVETVKEETKDEILEKKSIKEEEIAPKVVEAVAPSITVTSASPVVQKMDLKSEETPPKVVESNPKVEVVETLKESKVEAEKKEEEIKKQETVTPVVKAPVKEVTKSDSNPKTPKPSEADKKDEKLQYAEDQWSPLNQEGKKVYNRSFLLQFRNLSLSKPQDLPNIDDIVMDRPNPKAASQLPSYDGMFRGDRQMPDFTPKYLNQGGHGRSTSRGMRGPQRSGGYQHQHQGPPSQPKVVIKKVSIQREDDPLVRSENAWKPSKLDSKATDLSEEEQQTAEILRNVRAILNKLTPQKFQPLLQKVQALDINTEVRLRGVIDLIFEKAIDEPSFCEPYANMCRMMSQFRVSSAPGSGSNTFEFRKILLTRCQREFEKDRTNEEALNALKVKIENAEKPEVKQQLNDDLELETMKQRRRMLGNIRFIGELFKLNMLTESIMHNCIMSLFRARDEDSLECLCRLLNTIGKGLDHVKGKTRMDQYFDQMNKIVREQKTSSRVRFMLKDVIDLRLNNWVQRAIKSQGPKTIEQIHADAKEEKEQIALKAAAAAAAKAPAMNQPRGGRTSSRGGSSGHQGDEGWTKVGGAAQKPTRYDPNKMKLSKSQFDESNVTLGPSRGKSGWKSGSGSAATKSGSYSSNRDPEPAPRSSTPTIINRFSALGSQSQEATSPYQQRRAAGRQSSREATKSGSRGSMGPPAAPFSRGRDERQAVLDTARKLTSQEDMKRGSSPSVKSSPRSSATFTPIPQMDESFLTKKVDHIIKEYLHLVDLKEARECILELKVPPNLTHLIVSSSMESSLEKKQSDREHVATLICDIIKQRIVTEDEFLKGAAMNIELAADLELDLPKVWTCMAELVAPVIYDPKTGINLSHLVPMSQQLLDLDRSVIFVTEILKKMATLMPAEGVLKQWVDHNLQWSSFTQSTDPTQLNEILSKNNLSMFGGTSNGTHVSAVNQTSHKDFSTSVSEITRHLDKLQSDDTMFDWLEATFSIKERNESQFVRALTTAICMKAIVEKGGAMEVDKEVIKSRTLVFKKFVDTEDKELEAVYALQKLYSDLEQPPNILKLLFDLIYDEEIISEQTFFKWEKTDNPVESEGRGVALMSVKPFFTWLREADIESDE